MIGKLLCFIGLHKWKQVEDRLGGYGMGLEWFNCFECKRCMSTKDNVRSHGWELPQVNRDLRSRCPH